MGRPTFFRPRSLSALLAAAAVAAAGCEDAAGPTPAEAWVRGSVVTLDGGSAAGVAVRASWPGVEGSARIDAGGGFEVPLPQSPSGLGSLSLGSGDGEGRYHAAWIPLEADSLDVEGRILLVPRTWTVQRGRHAGTEVPVRPADAADSRVITSFWGLGFGYTQEGARQTVVDPTLWTGAFRSWEPSAFPVPLAFDRPRSDAAPSAADSAAMWRHLARLEEVLGRDLFRPAVADDLTLEGSDDLTTAPGAILVRFDADLGFRGRATPQFDIDWLRREDVAAWSGGEVTRMGVASGPIRGGVLRFREPAVLEDPRLVMHEAMHLLGAGHGCSWPSVQTYCASLERGEPTPEDVAHLEVVERAREVERPGGSWLLLPAIFGQRVLERGLGPIPPAEVVYGPDAGPDVFVWNGDSHTSVRVVGLHVAEIDGYAVFSSIGNIEQDFGMDLYMGPILQ